ncbi:MAG TPA: 3-deoxy-manno-octulosonate cytidylyltransferase [Gemmatimonadaceae bacterium]|nr:3-deoxy-manno-octulosonate cytidylyltransferase [Gemmatimonadaceae bacterium]
MSTLAVIPARLGATRLPSKPLRLLGGVPLIIRVWERLSAMRVADEIVVATDAESVADVCRHAGATVVITSAAHPSGTDRVAEVSAMRAYAAHDIVVNVQGDEPYIPHAAVEGAAELVEHGGFEMATAAAPDDDAILASPDVVKVVTDDARRALYFSRAPIPFLRDRSDAAVRAALVRRHIGVYAYRRATLARLVALPPHPLEISERLEQLRALAAGIAIGVAHVPRLAEGGIDTEEDLALANARWPHEHPAHISQPQS